MRFRLRTLMIVMTSFFGTLWGMLLFGIPLSAWLSRRYYGIQGAGNPWDWQTAILLTVGFFAPSVYFIIRTRD